MLTKFESGIIAALAITGAAFVEFAAVLLACKAISKVFNL